MIGISIIISPYFKESINENIQSELLEVALDYQENDESNITISVENSDYAVSLLMEKRILNEKNKTSY